MADDYKVLITGAVTVGIAVTAYLLGQAPLKSARPLPGEQSDLPSHVVTARLWEDPLEAAEAHAKAKRQADIEIRLNAGKDGRLTGNARMAHEDTPHHEFNEVWKGQPTGTRATVLLVMTDGTPYPEGHEFRLNTRYAVVSALHVGCYVAKDTLRYFQWSPRASSVVKVVSQEKQVNIPYEWYEYERRPEAHCSSEDVPHRVLVLWINNEAMAQEPLSWLSTLTRTLCDTADAGGACRNVKFKIIGPPDSDTFRTMLNEAINNMSSEKKLNWPPDHYIDLFSPWVTAADVIKLEEFGKLKHFDFGFKPKFKAQSVVSLVFLMAAVDIRYEITQDDILLLELMKELHRRNVDPAQDPIAIVGEWDSFYARVFSKELFAAACAWGYDNHERGSSAEQPCIEKLRQTFGTRKPSDASDVLVEALKSEPTMSNIRRYSYLRGLDGFVAKEAGDRDKDSDMKKAGKGKNKEGLVNVDYLERPEGESQFDYLRRLVARIKSDERKKGPIKAPRQNIKAIGIFGTDIYDRLLILQALRKEFPGAVFFMTDLHSRLFHEGQYNWTRNVVVSSAFGLELEKGLQMDTPPFRSSYQTATFFAVLQSVKQVEKQIQWCDNWECRYVYRSQRSGTYSHSIAPRLMEVGRYGSVDISTNPLHANLLNVHPPTPPKTPEIGWMGPSYWGFSKTIMILMAFALAFMFFTIPASVTFVKRHPIFTILLCVIALAVVLFEAALVRNNEEPFSLFDGVSTWPAIGIRVLALLLALYFLVESWAAIKSSNKDIPQKYRRLPPSDAMKLSSRSFWETWVWLSENPHKASKATQWDEVQKEWFTYQSAGTLRHRVQRILIMLLIYGGFIGFMVALVFGGFVHWSPCRGTVNCSTDSIVLKAAVALLVLLNLFVFDATRVCKAFVDRLIDEPSGRTLQIHAGHYMQLIKLIADRTKIIGPLVYYPFIVLSLMIVSRSRYFDNWDFPAALIVIWLINAALVFWSAYTLKRAADEARGRAIKNLQELSERQTGSADQIRGIMAEIKGTREGSFDHILQQPAISASLLAALAALQYYFTT